MMKLLVALIFFSTQLFAGVPPETVTGQTETSNVTTFNIKVPYNQATTTAGVTRRIETGNNNFLVNPSFEHSTVTTGWTSSNGTPTADTTNFHDGKKAMTISLTAINGDIESQSVTPGIQVSGTNIEHTLWVKTASTTLSVCSLQSGSEFQCNTVSGDSLWHAYSFVTPGSSSSISYGIKIKSTSSTTGTVVIDEGYVGEARNIQATVPQATLVGAAYYAGTASCAWSRTNTSFGDFSTSASCPAPTVEINPGPGVISTTDADLPQITATSLPAGNYVLVATVAAYTSTNDYGQLRISDGTTTSGDQAMFNNSGATVLPFTLTAVFSYTTPQASVTFKLQGKSGSGTLNITSGASFGNTPRFALYYFPSTASSAYIPPAAQGWYVDANTTGANPVLGTSAQTSYVEITDAGLTLTPRSGSAAVGTMCSSTNAATAPSTGATTCAAGSESLGINFTIPEPGRYKVCAAFAHFVSLASTVNTFSTFQLIETPTNAQTLTTEGGTRITSGGIGETISTGTAQVTVNPHEQCDFFTWSSSGTKGIRLMYEQSVSGVPTTNVVLADADPNNGQRDIHWKVENVSRNIPAPVLVNNVTAQYTGVTKINTITTVTASTYTALDTDETILLDSTSNSITVSFPPAANVTGKKYNFIVKAFTNAITLDPNASETVCGQTTIKVGGVGDEVDLQSDGTNWRGVAGTCTRTESVLIFDSGACTLQSNPRGWIASVTHNGTGDCTQTFLSGIFSSGPLCSPVIYNGVVADLSQCHNFSAPNTTSLRVGCTSNSGTAASQFWEAVCTGPR